MSQTLVCIVCPEKLYSKDTDTKVDQWLLLVTNASVCLGPLVY